MPKRKRDFKLIEDERGRRTTYYKRKPGIVRKATELDKITDSVSLMLFVDEKGILSSYISNNASAAQRSLFITFVEYFRAFFTSVQRLDRGEQSQHHGDCSENDLKAWNSINWFVDGEGTSGQGDAPINGDSMEETLGGDDSMDETPRADDDSLLDAMAADGADQELEEYFGNIEAHIEAASEKKQPESGQSL